MKKGILGSILPLLALSGVNIEDAIDSTYTPTEREINGTDWDSLIVEYFAILRKESKLPRSKRDAIVSKVERKRAQIRSRQWFSSDIWGEVKRYSKNGLHPYTVTITEDNIDNLYNSQFEDKTVYGEVYYYEQTI